MPSRRKKKRSCVKIRLLFWNTSCCLSYLLFLHWYISSDCMSQNVWQLSCRDNYKWLYGKERDTNSVIFLFVFFMFISKSSSSTTMKYFLHTRNFQNSSEIQRGLNVKSLQQQGLLFFSRSLPCSEGMAECARKAPQNVTVALSNELTRLESSWFFQSSAGQSGRLCSWVDSSLPDSQILSVILISVSGGIPVFSSNLL